MGYHAKVVRFTKIENEGAGHRAALLMALSAPILLAIALPVIVHALREHFVPHFYIICPLLTFTGIPCPFCGLTRSLLCLLHGEVAQAFWYHPFGPVVWGGTALFAIRTLVSLMYQHNITLRIPRRLKPMSLLVIVLLIWAGNVFLGHH
jgi:hypothetical protein